MRGRAISREVSLPIEPAEAFALLHTPSAICEWWSAARAIVAARPGGLWVAAWGCDEDEPECVTAARIVLFEPPARLRLGAFEYYTRAGGGLPFDAPLETEFSVCAAPGGCLLRAKQSGFPNDATWDEFYGACEKGWEATLGGLQRFVARRAPTNGVPTP